MIRGGEGLSELQKGSASAVFGKEGFNFQIVASPILLWAIMVTRWYNRSIGEYEQYAPIDWETLHAMGAPLAGLRYEREILKEFRRRNIPDDAYLKFEDGWCEIGGYTCSGQDAAHGLVSTIAPQLAPEVQERRIAELRTWMLENLRTQTDRSGDITALMPCLLIREPLLYCLNIEVDGFSGGSITLKQKGRILDVIPLHGRPILFPIGCAFEPPESGGVLIRSTDTVFQPDEDAEPPEVEVAIQSMYSEPGYLCAHIVGESRIPDEYELRDAMNTMIRGGKIRAPYRVKEYINCYLFGACCPEVLFRKNHGVWERFGPVIVGAVGESRARGETIHLTNLSPGENIEVCVFEVPGERAALTLQLIFSSVLHGDTVRDQCSPFWLEPGARILLSGATDGPVAVYLRAEGYYVKIH